MWTTVLGILGKLAGPLMKMLPFLAAYKTGKGKAEKEVIENTVEAKQKGEEAKQETKQKIRKSGVADYVENNDI